jgi:opacity protein-like surface antigen
MLLSCSISRSFRRRIGLATSVIALTSFSFAAMAQTDAAQTNVAQSDTTQTQSGDGHNFSSSTAFLSTDELLGAEPSAPTPAASPQYGGGNSYPHYPQSQNRLSHIAIEAGAGFTAPIGNDVSGGKGYGLSGYDTWGYNVTVGGGWNFTKRIGLLLEYQFDKQKIPGATLTTVYNEAQAGGAGLSSPLNGNINTWSFTLAPIIYQPITKKTGVYVTGGGGFYRKVTNFTEEVLEESFFGEFAVPETVNHSSSNQGGLNIGAGVYRKVFGEDSNAKLYAEVRYLWVNSPVSLNQPLPEGTEGLIPVSFGIRF